MDNSLTKNSFVVVAASDSTEEAKSLADFICTGSHDEKVIQEAVDLASKTGKGVFLLNGIYYVEGFYDFGDGGPKTAIRLAKKGQEFIFRGENKNFSSKGSTILYVKKNAFDSVGSDESVDVIRSDWTERGILNGRAVDISRICITVYDASHPMRCIDLRRSDYATVSDVRITPYGRRSFENPDFTVSSEHDIPKEGCIGITLTDGSNHPGNNFVNIMVSGFDECIQVGGEHVVLVNCYAAFGRYGYTFGNYEANCGLNHPITLINCCDELNINLPLFNRCGDGGGELAGNQEVTMINFSIERIAEHTPGGKLGDCMKETKPGTWRGRIETTVQPAWNHTNDPAMQLWENDGSGVGIITRNSTHKSICSTAERLSYYPTYGQQIFDTDINKMVICTNPENKTWVDFNGNTVD